MSTNNAWKVPPLIADTQGDKAAGSSAMNIALAYSNTGTLSSAEDELFRVMTLLGKGIGTKPTNRVLIIRT